MHQNQQRWDSPKYHCKVGDTLLRGRRSLNKIMTSGKNYWKRRRQCRMNFSKVQDKCLSTTKQIDCIAQYLE